MLQKFKQDIKNDLIAGLVVVIPLATTIWLTINVAIWVISFITRFPKQLNPFTGLNPFLVALINLGIGFAVPILALLLIGLMARNFAGRWLLDLGERIVQSIPLAGSVYKTIQQLLQTVFQDSKSRFRRVVLIEYPRRGLWAIAFVTSSALTNAPEGISSKMLSVFIPTTPNPTSGWYSVVSEDDILNLSISVEDAFKVLLSGGIVGPNLAAEIPPHRIRDGLQPGEANGPSELPADTSLGSASLSSTSLGSGAPQSALQPELPIELSNARSNVRQNNLSN
ncbi:MAG: DUF502 domain-containing protein [Cyanobacteria bacterium J06621_11]